MTKLDAKNMPAKELCARIRESTDTALAVEHVNGQRYIAAGLGKKELTLTGTPGNALGAYLNGTRITVLGNAQDATGDTMNDGAIFVHGSSGDATGYAMRGGKIYVRGNAGYRAGIHMKAYREKQPVLIIGGEAGSFLGEYQAGGIIIVLGLGSGGRAPVGRFVGTGMHGGRMLLRCDTLPPDLPAQVAARRAGKDDLAAVDIWDEKLWFLCNPSLGKHLSLRNIRLEAMEARRSEAGEKLFRWLRLNQWISVKAVSWISLTLYDKTQWGPSKRAERTAWLEQLKGKLCYGGVDLSTSKDLTAFVLLFPPQPGLETAVLLPYIWRPGATAEEAERRDHVPYRDWARAGFLQLCDGDIINYSDVEEAIQQAREDYDLRMVGFDPYLSRTITQRLEPIVPVMEIPQDLRNMSPAMKEMDDLMTRQLLHVHNTCFRWTFGNVRCHVDGNGNIKPLKNKSIGRIDPPVAAIISIAVWMIMRTKHTYDTRHLREDWGL